MDGWLGGWMDGWPDKSINEWEHGRNEIRFFNKKCEL